MSACRAACSVMAASVMAARFCDRPALYWASAAIAPLAALAVSPAASEVVVVTAMGSGEGLDEVSHAGVAGREAAALIEAHQGRLPAGRQQGEHLEVPGAGDDRGHDGLQRPDGPLRCQPGTGDEVFHHAQ